MISETVTITYQEYENLKQAARKLEALEDAGVDNWEGYSAALSGFYKEE